MLFLTWEDNGLFYHPVPVFKKENKDMAQYRKKIPPTLLHMELLKRFW